MQVRAPSSQARPAIDDPLCLVVCGLVSSWGHLGGCHCSVQLLARARGSGPPSARAPPRSPVGDSVALAGSQELCNWSGCEASVGRAQRARASAAALPQLLARQLAFGRGSTESGPAETAEHPSGQKGLGASAPSPGPRLYGPVTLLAPRCRKYSCTLSVFPRVWSGLIPGS